MMNITELERGPFEKPNSNVARYLRFENDDVHHASSTMWDYPIFSHAFGRDI